MRITALEIKDDNKHTPIKKITQVDFENEKIKVNHSIKTFDNLDIEDSWEENIINANNELFEWNKRFLKLLNFIGAKTKTDREKIAKDDPKLTEFNTWLDAFSNKELVKKELDDYDLSKIVYFKHGEASQANIIAINMLKKNCSKEFISEVTQLPLKEVIELNSQINN